MTKYKYDIIIWKDHTEKYENYWNDQKVESIFNDAEYLKIDQYIEEQGFFVDLENCLKYLIKRGKKISGTGAELASGSMWLTAHIMKSFYDQIQQFYSLDYSKKYIFHIGPKLLNYYKVLADKLILCLRSFYEIKLTDKNIDFIIMSQAFHNADQELYFPPDQQLGDHYYLKSQYENLFLRNKFEFMSIKSKQPNHLAYVISKT